MQRALSRGLALAFLDGEWTPLELLARGQLSLDRKPAWLRPLCRRVCKRFEHAPSDIRELAQFIEDDARFRYVLTQLPHEPRIRRWFFPEQRMVSVVGAPARFEVPALDNEQELAEVLGLAPSDLDWFADVSRRNAGETDQRLRHYRYRWVKKRSGGVRLLETPKARIKHAQRWIARNVLAKIPPEHSAHGFVTGRSTATYVTAHIGKSVVLRLDLEDFFASITAARVRAMFCRVGYPESVARKLAGLCCVSTPDEVLAGLVDRGVPPADHFQLAQRLRNPHLPQGAPTSPALSNLIAFRLDRRLSGLARAAGASYSRYADDLAFSGDASFARALDRWIPRVAAIVLEEGFRVRYRKTRVMRAGGQQKLAGLIVNAKPSVPRREYDRLRATLHNAARLGPASQNRDRHDDFRAHLAGRIAWVAATNSKRGDTLRKLFDHIAW